MNESPTILVLEYDKRVSGNKPIPGASDSGPGGMIQAPDWRMFSASGFGNRLRNQLPKGDGYWSEVTDCGQWVSVKVGYSCVGTGRTVTKTFIIVFDSPDNGNGRVFASSTKWRSVSNTDQAANYIGSVIRNMSQTARNPV